MSYATDFEPPTNTSHAADSLTPDEVAVIELDVAAVVGAGDDLARSFYEVVFDMAPQARPMFPDDLTEQRRKLMAELSALVSLAIANSDDDASSFTRRTAALGRRHVGYGVQPAHYDVVGAALLTALGRHVPAWDDVHVAAWGRLYGLVAEAMQRGAEAGADVAVVGAVAD